MDLRSQMAKSILLAGIPLLTLPLLAESGMSRNDRAQIQDRKGSNAAQQIIEGVISKKNAEEITLRTSDGKRITFRINDQTNQLCPQGTQTSHTSSMRKESAGNQNSAMEQGSSTGKSSGQNQVAQGSSGGDSSTSDQTSSSSLFGIPSEQNSGQSSSVKQNESQQSQQQGFRFGECNFQKGEFVKAKLDENKTATFVRSMGDSEEYYGTGGVEGEYFVLPAGQLGGLDISDKDANYSVKSTDGKEIGSVYRVMTNNNGDISYAIIRKPDGQLISVPWQALEGAGNKSFKLKVTQNQLGNLPILNEGENVGAHVQKHWNLTEQERKNLAKWNERQDERNQVRDRYYEDTPTFPNNREGYDRYDQNRSRMSRSGDDRQRQYQDQNAEEYQTKRNDFSPTEFPPHDRAFQYEGADQHNSSNRNRQGSYSNDYRDRGNGQYSRSGDRNYNNSGDGNYGNQSRSNRRNDDFQNNENPRSMYSQSREGNYKDPMEQLSDRYNTTAPRSDYDSQRQNDDQYQSRGSNKKDYDDRPEGYRP
ncbi:hypothetical protein [uncultured Nitrospira sp.]|uniref:hypothetical protein n=1 Tax=uncultured Nitrospira sp. TaxID=157176 RepID=UPI003140BDCA